MEFQPLDRNENPQASRHFQGIESDQATNEILAEDRVSCQ